MNIFIKCAFIKGGQWPKDVVYFLPENFVNHFEFIFMHQFLVTQEREFHFFLFVTIE